MTCDNRLIRFYRSNFSQRFNSLCRGRRNIFIQTENTPNPDSLKFYPTGKEILPEGTGTFSLRKQKISVNCRLELHFRDLFSWPRFFCIIFVIHFFHIGTKDYPTLSTATNSPLAKRLFRVEGVRSVFLANAFVTVNKVRKNNKKWSIFVSLLYHERVSNEGDLK